METMKRRLLKFLDYKNLGQSKFEEMCGIGNGNTSKVKNKFGKETLMKIYRTFPELSPKWLESGEGKMILEHVPKKGEIPLLNGFLVAGTGNELSGFVVDEYVLPPFLDRKVDFLIQAYGESMMPTINSGDILACRMVSRPFLIKPNEIYAIATLDDSFVKRIRPIPDSNLWEMVSDNSVYAPFTVEQDSVLSIAQIVGVVSVKKF